MTSARNLRASGFVMSRQSPAHFTSYTLPSGFLTNQSCLPSNSGSFESHANGVSHSPAIRPAEVDLIELCPRVSELLKALPRVVEEANREDLAIEILIRLDRLVAELRARFEAELPVIVPCRDDA